MNKFVKNVSSNDLERMIIRQYNIRAEQYFENKLSFNINPDGLKEAIDSKQQKIVIIDVRSGKAFRDGHIPGAINIPFNEYNFFEGDKKKFFGLIKDDFNYVYCYSLLCMLGQKACKKFASLGYAVKEVKGGFKSWQDYGYDIEI